MLLAVFSVLFLSVSVPAATKLNKRQLSIYVGGTYRLSPTSGKASKWTSSDPSIATVSSNGTVTGISKGTATISCTVSGKTASCTLNVRTKRMSKYISNGRVRVWMNMLGAVESGGQQYGKRNYTSFAGPGANSSA